MKKILKWLAYIAAGFIALISLLAGVSQTQFFRDRLRSFVLSELDSLFDASISLGPLYGNLVTGFSIDSLSVEVQGAPLITAEHLVIGYDLLALPSRQIRVRNLTLVRPQIALVCAQDGVWNFERMIRPTPEDTSGTAFGWPIRIERFEIKEGSFRLLDSAALAEPEHERTSPYFVEYHDIALRELNLVLSPVRILPDEKLVRIAQCAWISDRPDVQLRKLSGELRVTPWEARVSNLAIQTSRSNLMLDASMQGIDLLDGIELELLQAKPVELNLRTSDLDLDELKRFIHQIDFLHGKVRADIVADGQFGRLQVKQLDLVTGSSELHLAGTVSNLHIPEELVLNVKCRESIVAYSDVRALMPSLSLPDFASLGSVVMDFDFDGMPLDFRTSLDLQSEAGSISTKDATLTIGGPSSLSYDATFGLRNVDLALVFPELAVRSSLTGGLRVSGRGTDLATMHATAELELDSSVIEGQPVVATRIALGVEKGTLTTTSTLAVGSMRAELSAQLDDAAGKAPRFSIRGTISSLNLADILKDPTQDSDLTLKLVAKGAGLKWENLNCTAQLDFSSSRYREYRIDSSAVHLAIDQRDPMHSSISIRSDLADFLLQGRFDLDYMMSLLRYEIGNLRLAIARRFQSVDPSLLAAVDERALRTAGKQLAGQAKVLDAEYELRIKNLEPLSILTGNRTFDAIGVLQGSLRGNYTSLAGDARLEVQEFFYGNADSGVLIQDGLATLRFNDLQPTNPLSVLTLRIRADAGKMHINRTRLDTLKFGIFYDKEYAGFIVQADYDQDYHFRTNGQVGVTDDGVQFTLSNLNLGYKDYMWKADDGGIIAIGRNGMRVHPFVLRRDSQTVSFHGSLSSDESLQATLQGRHLDISSLKYVLREAEQGAGERQFEGVANFDAQANGTLADPTYDAVLTVHQVFFRGLPFGDVHGTLHYENELLTTTVEIDSRTDKQHGTPDLTIRGTLPIRLGLRNVHERFPDAAMEFDIRTDGLQMSLLDPLVPTFNELTGIVKADLKITGSPQRPSFAGSMSIENCAFLFEPNNMYYKLEGRFQPDGERIKVLDAVIRNVDADNRPGRVGLIHITGDFAFRDLVPSDFRAEITGQLLVVNQNTLSSSLGVYGELPVEVTGKGLRFTGNIDRSLLKGDVLVRNASLAFPPTTSGAREDTFFIPFRLVDDTARVRESEARAVAARYFSMARKVHGGTGDTLGFMRAPSFIDGLRYDLNVEFAGSNNEIRMIFNAATNEELVANITGRVAITEDGKYWVGTLDVLRASYNFYGKRFDAEGTITYAGDLLNPELNITATYRGTRTNEEVQPPAIEHVVVTYKITGTRLAPKPEISMKIDDVDYASYTAGPKSGDVQSDALTFIITNTFPLSRGERNNIAEQIGPTVGAGLVGGATSLLTSTLAEFLRTKTGFIQSFELRYDTSVRGGSFGQSADVRLGGTAFRGYWRYGGKILEDPFSNANVSILYSLGDIFDRPSLRNFMIELERRVDTSTLFGSIETRKEINSARFFYRFSF